MGQAPETDPEQPAVVIGADPEDLRPGIRIVEGEVTEEEFVAVTTVVAGMSAVSRAEATERVLREQLRPSVSAWNAPVRTVQRSRAVRDQPGPSAWEFCDRD